MPELQLAVSMPDKYCNSIAVGLLKAVIETPSHPGNEDKTAEIISYALLREGITPKRVKNNIYAVSKHYAAGRPVVFLCSHHDTVAPNKGYTRNPYVATEHDGCIYGLGSNDAGGSLAALYATFVALYNTEGLPYNLVFAAVAEEEISGENGITALLADSAFKKCCGILDESYDPWRNWCGIIGEPTGCHAAVAEMGLLVIDAEVTGKAGHAARDNGDNALYKAIAQIERICNMQLPVKSRLLGAVHLAVTTINTPNRAHNVIPDKCFYTIDVRVTDGYTHDELLTAIATVADARLTARSMRLRSTVIPEGHALVRAVTAGGLDIVGSATCSDKGLLPFDAIKLGPGDSKRSHAADEFIYLAEVEQGIDTYRLVLENYARLLKA